jgi:hypothetical protein
MDFKLPKNFQVPNGPYLLKILLIFILLLLVFQAGEFVGFRKATFAGQLGDNYYRAFGNHRPPFFNFQPGDFPGDHGANGKIVRLDQNTLVIAATDNVEKTILISKDTLIRRWRENLTAKDLQVNDWVIVLGEPNNQGEIGAKLIRIMPGPPPNQATPSASSTPN